jgi:oxaloacetate decarboxylase gamma subunit
MQPRPAMSNELIDQGVTLLLAGMGTVFAFLTMLVVAITLMSKLLTRRREPPATADISDAEVAAISAAIVAHRQK